MWPSVHVGAPENEPMIAFIVKLHRETRYVESRMPMPMPMASHFELGGTVGEAAEAEAVGGVCREGRQTVLSW